MTTQFIIRDDDTCFFTNPQSIDELYSPIWTDFPVTLGVVPWQKGTFAGHVPVKYWQSDQVYAIGDNRELICYLSQLLQESKLDVALHGIHHTYQNIRNKFIPELVNFDGNFELDLTAAKSYLENLFGINIEIFIPPSNTMSSGIAKILIDNNWSLLNIPGLRRNTRPLVSFQHQTYRLKRLKSFVIDGVDLSKPLVRKNGWEVGGFPLTPNTNIDLLKKSFHIALDSETPFVLATHYWEHDTLLPDGKKTQYDVLNEFLDYVVRFDINPIKARDLNL